MKVKYFSDTDTAYMGLFNNGKVCLLLHMWITESHMKK